MPSPYILLAHWAPREEIRASAVHDKGVEIFSLFFLYALARSDYFLPLVILMSEGGLQLQRAGPENN